MLSAVKIFESVVAIVESLVVIVESVVGIINYVRNFQICGYHFESMVVISSLRSFDDLLKSFLSEFFGVFFSAGDNECVELRLRSWIVLIVLNTSFHA